MGPSRSASSPGATGGCRSPSGWPVGQRRSSIGGQQVVAAHRHRRDELQPVQLPKLLAGNGGGSRSVAGQLCQLGGRVAGGQVLPHPGREVIVAVTPQQAGGPAGTRPAAGAAADTWARRGGLASRPSPAAVPPCSLASPAQAVQGWEAFAPPYGPATTPRPPGDQPHPPPGQNRSLRRFRWSISARRQLRFRLSLFPKGQLSQLPRLPSMLASIGRPIGMAEPLLQLGCLLVALDRPLMGGQLRHLATSARSRALVSRCWASSAPPAAWSRPPSSMTVLALVSKPANYASSEHGHRAAARQASR